MSRIARMLDANANRAREAIRVLEDAARFALDDPALSGRLKALRHELRAALAHHLPPGWLEAGRDVAGDVGTALTEPAERSRAGLADVAAAAGSRLGEALRVIEETAKTVSPQLAEHAEAIRYRAYELGQAVNFGLRGGRARQWAVAVLLTESLCARPWGEVLRAVVGGGADCIQVREKGMAAAQLARRVEMVLEVARPAGVSVIVNDRLDVALAAGADGAHLGAADLPIAAARRVAGRTILLGASTHDPDEARAAVEAGADYCGVGCMFATATAPGAAVSGLAYLRAFVQRYPGVPHLAIGGVNPGNAGALVAAGARGVAVSSAVCGAAWPDRVVERLRQAMEGKERRGLKSPGVSRAQGS